MVLLEELTWLGSSITDWIQSLAALIAVPGAIAGFIFLFRKDQEKDKQIKELSDIASKIENQNRVMQEGNSILNAQVDIWRNVLISQIEAKEGANKLVELEEQKFLLSIRPRLFSNGGMLHLDEVDFLIENFGELAFIKSVKNISSDNKLIMKNPISTSLELEKNSSFKIKTTTANRKIWSSQQINHRFEIQYTDKAGNLYKQEVFGTVGQEYKISDPELINRLYKNP